MAGKDYVKFVKKLKMVKGKDNLNGNNTCRKRCQNIESKVLILITILNFKF